MQCLPVKDLSETCLRDEECSNSMACTSGKCQLYGSLEDYEVSDNNLACKSGFINQGTSKPSVCVPSPQIIDKNGPDYQCASATDTCKYQVSGSSPFTFETPCACGLNPTGASFCPHVYTSSYTTLLRRVTEKLASHCHTTDRVNIYECLTSTNVTDENDKQLLNEFIVEHFEREANNQVRQNDHCMRSHSQVS